MNIALIGSGGREDALCRKLKDSKKTNNIFCIPGNAGTAKIANNNKIFTYNKFFNSSAALIISNGGSVCNSGAPVLCGYLPVIIEFLLGLQELVVKYIFLKSIPSVESLSILGVFTCLLP